jgi:hypothetical protein
MIRNCVAAPGTATFLGLAGEESRDISALNNDLRCAKTPQVP